MSDARPLPLFFSRVVGVDPLVFPELRLDRATGYGFAAAAQSVPLGLDEIETAAQHYPVLFTTGPDPVPVALLGLKDGHNLFVSPRGTWLHDAYVPGYVRAFPFVFVGDPGRDSLLVAMEPDAPSLNSGGGERLFEDGRPTPVMNEAMAFSGAVRDGIRAARVFGAALETAGLLEEEEATVTFTAGGATRIRGFKVVKRDRFAGLDDELFLEWRRMGWLSATYGHLYSVGRWARLIALASPARL